VGEVALGFKAEMEGRSVEVKGKIDGPHKI
jgi:hypothetical protein